MNDREQEYRDEAERLASLPVDEQRASNGKQPLPNANRDGCRERTNLIHLAGRRVGILPGRMLTRFLIMSSLEIDAEIEKAEAEIKEAVTYLGWIYGVPDEGREAELDRRYLRPDHEYDSERARKAVHDAEERVECAHGRLAELIMHHPDMAL